MHHFSIRVYYEDTDAGGIVYYANYLKFAERARTECLRAHGIGQRRLYEEEGIAFVVKNLQMDFLQPAKLDDDLTIETRLVDIKGAQLRMQQRIHRNEETCVNLEVRLAVIGRNGRPVRLPACVNAAFQALSPST